MAGYFRGTSNEEDYRFNKTKKSVQTLPSEFSLTVDMKKVNQLMLKSYISVHLEKVLGVKDEIVESLILDFLDDKNTALNPVAISDTLQGFSNAADSMSFTCSLMRFLHAESTKEPASKVVQSVAQNPRVPNTSSQVGPHSSIDRSKEMRNQDRGSSRKSRSRSRSPGGGKRSESWSRSHRRPAPNSSHPPAAKRVKDDDRFKENKEQ